jgi:hypothetical protein
VQLAFLARSTLVVVMELAVWTPVVVLVVDNVELLVVPVVVVPVAALVVTLALAQVMSAESFVLPVDSRQQVLRLSQMVAEESTAQGELLHVQQKSTSGSQQLAWKGKASTMTHHLAHLPRVMLALASVSELLLLLSFSLLQGLLRRHQLALTERSVDQHLPWNHFQNGRTSS